MSIAIKFSDRESWLEGRRKLIGSSDVRAIFGQGYAGENKLSVYVDKVSDEPRRDPPALLKKFRAGQRAERLVLETFADEMDVEVFQHSEPTVYRHTDIEFIGATIDGWIEGETGKEVVEAKFIGHHAVHDWTGDEPPLAHALQVCHQLLCTNWKRGHLVGWTGEQLFTFTIERRDDVAAFLSRELTAFWMNHVVPRIPPEPDYSDASAEAIRRLFPVDSGEVVDLPRELVDLAEQLEAAKEAAKEAEQRKEQLANQLKLALGEASYGVLPDGSCLSYKLQSCKGYYVEPKSFRVLRRLKKVPKEVALAIPAQPRSRRQNIA